jgi:hypothetical protein
MFVSYACIHLHITTTNDGITGAKVHKSNEGVGCPYEISSECNDGRLD